MEPLTFEIKNYKEEILSSLDLDQIFEKNMENLRNSSHIWNKEELEELLKQEYQNKKQELLNNIGNRLDNLIGYTYTYEEGREDLGIAKGFCSPEKLYIGLKDEFLNYLDCTRIIRTFDLLTIEEKIKKQAKIIAEQYALQEISNLFGNIYSRYLILDAEQFLSITQEQ